MKKLSTFPPLQHEAILFDKKAFPFLNLQVFFQLVFFPK